MKSICFYFQVHQPFRIRKYSFFEDSEADDYFIGPENYENQKVFEKVAKKCYLPTTNLLLELLERHPEFRIAFSLSGVFLEQCQQYGGIGRQVLNNFKALAQTGRVEFLGETYHHSLSFLYSKLEFIRQVQLHSEKIYELFGVMPQIFRNTELIYSDELAEFVRQLGFQGILAEGWDAVLDNGNPNVVRTAKKYELHLEDKKIIQNSAPKATFANVAFLSEKKQMPVLCKNYKLSDDIAFRFGNKGWKEFPLVTEKFGHWVENTSGDTINLFMDFETFGEHQWEDTGIFEFISQLPTELLRRNIGFRTPSETIKTFATRGEFSSPQYLSWADEQRDLSAWLENDLQRSAFEEVSEMERTLHFYQDSKNQKMRQIIEDFRKLQTSDHFYYMCTKYWNDGDVHTYFSPYESPYDAFINYMNVLEHMKTRIKEQVARGKENLEIGQLTIQPFSHSAI